MKRGAHAADKSQARLTALVFDLVWTIEVLVLDFKSPLVDKEGAFKGKHGRAFDVYLADIGADGATQGECFTAKSAKKPRGAADARAGYCVMDNDYAEFADDELTALEALEATAAHEFFHAVQYAYDAVGEPEWLTEGTAVWMEDEAFDEINTGYAFLDVSPLANPEAPLSSSPYGSWVFWRFSLGGATRRCARHLGLDGGPEGQRSLRHLNGRRQPWARLSPNCSRSSQHGTTVQGPQGPSPTRREPRIEAPWPAAVHRSTPPTNSRLGTRVPGLGGWM